MAETEAAAHAGGKAAGKGFEALKQKVGPLPLYVWLIAAVGIWYYMQRKNTKTTAGQQTDSAGNTGTIDPATGYVYGSPQDQSALSTQSGAGGSGSSGATGGSTIAGQYPDNPSWGRAAINYLVGLGVDPTTANEAIQSYLASQPLTSNQQADVNLAIQALGAPPSPPGPVGNTPPPVVVPVVPGGTGGTTPPPGGGGTVYASNPPSGFAVTQRNATSIGLKWNAVKNATGYTVAWDTTSGGQKNHQNTSTPSVTIGNLHPNTAYYFEVWADPTKTGGPHAGPILGHTTGNSPLGSSGSKKYTVKSGDTLSGIAQKLNYPGGWQALYSKNKSVIGNDPNVIKPGEELSL